MKILNLAQATLVALLLPFSAFGEGKMLKLKITNTGEMPISPGLVYLQHGQTDMVAPGQMTTEGFNELCKSGSPEKRFNELQKNPTVVRGSVIKTTGPILPGASIVIEVDSKYAIQRSLHFEAMYGKTVDVCATAAISGLNLAYVRSGWVNEFNTNDNVVNSGSFNLPKVNSASQACNQDAAVKCLRSLASENSGQKIKAFSGYLPSVINLLESTYGADETQALIIPSSGAVRFSLTRK